MFTGLVSDVGEIVTAEGDPRTLRRFVVASGYDPAGILIGASIACSGVCLTAVAVEPRPGGGCRFTVEAAAETLARTTISSWDVGRRINLERSLKVGDELGGHLVTGHVDGVGELVRRETVTPGDSLWGETMRLTVRIDPSMSPFVATKGSICIDGASLTVNRIDGDDVSVLLIPHTIAVTTFQDIKAGQNVNVEVDMLARYARRLIAAGAIGFAEEATRTTG